MSVTVTPFTRRVSFSNFEPEPAAYAREVDFSDYNLGYGTSVVNDISKIYSNSFARVRKRRRSAAPTKSILKNKLSPQQLRYNAANAETLGINYHQDLDDLVVSDDEPDVPAPPTARRKSYSDMTDDELMALDPQFANAKSNLDKFKFDSVSTYYRPERKASTVAHVSAAVDLPDSHNYKGVSLTMQHEHFDNRRTLLTVVSGRQHTWNSLDWLAKSRFLEHGDYVVVAAVVPAKYKNKPEMVYKRCERLLDYVAARVDPELSVKITVEFVLHEDAKENPNKAMLKNLFLYYNPQLVVLGNKNTSLNFKYPIKLKESTAGNFLVKYSTYLVKYSTVPVILVGNSAVGRAGASRKGSYVSEMESISSASDSSSDIAKVTDYSHPQAYENLVRQISDRSLDQSREYLHQLKSHQEAESANPQVPQIKFDDSVTFDSKIHTIYNSQITRSTSGNSDKVYRVKSLFDSDKPEKPVESSDSNSINKITSGERLTLKQIKSNLKKEPVKKAPAPEKKKSLWKKLF